MGGVWVDVNVEVKFCENSKKIGGGGRIGGGGGGYGWGVRVDKNEKLKFLRK